MRTNHVKRALRGGGLSVGTFVFEFATTGIGRIVAGAGADFVVFDMEHTGWSLETIRMLVATSRIAETTPVVRVPATEYHFIARTLDVGAMGVMVPMVESAEQARKIVQSAYYPPIGRRGVAVGVSHDDYAGGHPEPKIRSANNEVLLIAQIETVAGVENVEAIAAVEGIDVLFVGPYDLTSSMGILGQFDNPKYLKALSHVLEVSKRAGKAVGCLAGGVEDARNLVAQGVTMLGFGGDIWIYQQALAEGIAQVRKS